MSTSYCNFPYSKTLKTIKVWKENKLKKNGIQ